MCGIAGIVNLDSQPIQRSTEKLDLMNRLLAHRGPDGAGVWTSSNRSVGMAHRRLAIIDLSEAAAQPMTAPNNTTIVHNGEIYNFIELRDELKGMWDFKSASDTETILASYEVFGGACIDHLRGMFAFAIWDERKQQLFCARDRFGIKPFYYSVVGNVLVFASEIKALLPFLPEISTDADAFSEYLTFQYTIGEHTLFKGVKQLLPGHTLTVKNGRIAVERYWDVHYDVDFDHSPSYFQHRLPELVDESIDLHLRSDVPVGVYLSGGVDSSLIATLAAQRGSGNGLGFHGKFTGFPGYDESSYARIAAGSYGGHLQEIDITAADFRNNFEKVIYHLDHPVAGPGSFPQYMVSKLASKSVKVALGGQGGDEIFGGYARYVLAYFEQAIKAAIDGTYRNGNFVVTPESIIPNLGVLQEYKPLIKEFWSAGLFGSLDERYFRLIDRSTDMEKEIRWDELDKDRVYSDFRSIFNNTRNVGKEAYFDSMTHFDFKCLLPALLHVEDRMSMAHGLESRVPFLDHPLVEFAATVPADVKFEGGRMKHLIKQSYDHVLPQEILQRRDKMGFPVPLKEWFSGELREMVHDILRSEKARHRPFVNYEAFVENFDETAKFSRKTWALLSIELWHQIFHDQAAGYRKMAA